MQRVYLAFELLRLRDREMPGQVTACFFYVAAHDGCHKQAIEQELGLSTASSSRNTDILSTGRVGRDANGLGLIIKGEDKSNRRRQILRLSPLGKDLALMIKQTLYD